MENKHETAEAYILAGIGAIKGVYEEFVRPSPGVCAWGAIALGVAVYEAKCPPGQLLSESVDRGIEKHPILTLGAIAITAAHLANVLPEKIDPYHQGVELIRRGYGK